MFKIFFKSALAIVMAATLTACFGSKKGVGTPADNPISPELIMSIIPGEYKAAGMISANADNGTIDLHFPHKEDVITVAFRLYPAGGDFVIEVSPIRYGALGTPINTYGYLKINNGEPEIYYALAGFKGAGDSARFLEAVAGVHSMMAKKQAFTGIPYLQPYSIEQVGLAYRRLIREGGLKPVDLNKIFGV